MNTAAQIKALTDTAEGYVLLPAGDGYPECLTNTDDLLKVRARMLSLHPSLINTADGLARIGSLLTEKVRELDAFVADGKPVTPEQLNEMRTDVRLSTYLLGEILGCAIAGQGSPLYRGFATMIVDAEEATKLLTIPLAEQAS